MKILVLEFSSAQRSVAVGRIDSESSPRCGTWREVIEGGPESRPLGMIESALRGAGLEREQIDTLAIGLGPGSYVGIRQAIALAQGWGLAQAVKIHGVSSADCLAAQAQAQGMTGMVHVVLDAQRGEFYLATYEITAIGWRPAGPLRLASLEEVRSTVRVGSRVIGHGLNKWFPEAYPMFPRAETLGQLAAGGADSVAAELLEPIYLRETSFVKAPPPRIW